MAVLARIKIAEEELESLNDELNSIFDWIKRLDEVDTKDVLPLTSVMEMELHRRQDEVLEGESREKILANSPENDDVFFVVPKVID